MNREDAEKLASEFLKRPVDQFYDEHYRIDNPAMYQIIMDVSQFTPMLERRGYSLEVQHEQDGDYFVAVCGSLRTIIGEEFFKYQTIAEVARQLDRLVGMHHMCCKQCQEPLLQEHYQQRMQRPYYSDSPAIDPTYAQFEYKQPRTYYRSAKAGPDSESLTHCPGCQYVLSVEIVKEIEDV